MTTFNYNNFFVRIEKDNNGKFIATGVKYIIKDSKGRITDKIVLEYIGGIDYETMPREGWISADKFLIILRGYPEEIIEERMKFVIDYYLDEKNDRRIVPVDNCEVRLGD